MLIASTCLTRPSKVLEALWASMIISRVYTHFSKAFDKWDRGIPHKSRPTSMSILGKIGRWIYNVLEGHIQRNVNNELKSEIIVMKSLVSHAIVLTRMFFIIMIVDTDSVLIVAGLDFLRKI